MRVGHSQKDNLREHINHILIVTAVDAEKEAVLRGLGDHSRFDVLSVGVGPVAAAVGTAAALAAAACRYDLVVCAGIGGGFAGRAAVGSLVIASEIVAADLGAETPEGFSSLDKLGFGSTRIEVDQSLTELLTSAMQAAGLPVHAGPILTVSTVTGTAETAKELTVRVPMASAEAMEGFGAAAAALQFGIPVLEIRAISNAVGPRDREAWRLGDALQALEKASTVIAEVLI